MKAARELYAQQLERQGPAWTNAANSVRAGYENSWIAAGIAAIEAVLKRLPHDEDD